MRGYFYVRRRGLGSLGALLSPTDIQTLASNAGFSGPDLATAVAIALAESNPPGNPNSYNPETNAPGGTPQGKGSYGLWQIYLKDHPEYAGANLFDPQTNANAAYTIYSQHGFSAWSSYKFGRYRSFLQNVPPFPGAPESQPPVVNPPLTIDASTGQVIDDSTPTPPVQAGFQFPTTGNTLLDLTLAGFGAYLLADWFLGD